MKRGDTWGCDRCGTEVEMPYGTKHLPHGWEPISPPGISGEREACVGCVASFRSWWYAPAENIAELAKLVTQ